MMKSGQIMRSSGFSIGGPRANRPLVIPTTAQARSDWLRHRKLYRDITDETDKYYRQHTTRLGALVGEETPINEVTLEDFEEVLAAVKAQGFKIDAAFRSMKAFLRWCGRRGYPVDDRFAWGLESLYSRPADENDVDIFSPKELAVLEREMSTSRRNRLIYGLLLGTGIRVRELSMLTLASREDNLLHVPFAKGKKHRRVPMSGRLQKDWDDYVRKERPEHTMSERLLLTERRRTANYRFDFQPMSKRAVQILLYRLEQRLGFECYPHKFRHSYATIWIMRHMEEGATPNLDDLRRYLGHTDQKTTLIYVNLAKNLVSKGYERYLPY